MPIETWLNPIAEVIGDEGEDLVDQIAESYTQIGIPDPEEDPVKEILPVRMSEALAALRLYQEQQSDGSREVVRSLNRWEREMRGKQANRATQRTILLCQNHSGINVKSA